MAVEETVLSGTTAIREFCRTLGIQSSEASVMYFIVCCEFPARKLNGQWVSDKEEIRTWWKRFIRGEINVKEKEEAIGKKPPEKVKAIKGNGNQKRGQGSKRAEKVGC